MILNYFHQSDEIFPSASLTIDDDNDWWAGAQKCFAGLALAAILAVGTAQTAITTQLQWQDEIPAGSLHGQYDEDFWQNPVAPVPSSLQWPQQFSFDVQEPAGSLFGQPDEDFWINPVAPVPDTYLWPQQSFFDTAESIPKYDEDFWINQVAPTQDILTWPQQFTFDVQEPANSLHGQPDEDFWINPIAPVLDIYKWPNPFLFDIQESAGSLFGQPDEDFDWRLLFPAPTSRYLVWPQQFSFDIQTGTLSTSSGATDNLSFADSVAGSPVIAQIIQYPVTILADITGNPIYPASYRLMTAVALLLIRDRRQPFWVNSHLNLPNPPLSQINSYIEQLSAESSGFAYFISLAETKLYG